MVGLGVVKLTVPITPPTIKILLPTLPTKGSAEMGEKISWGNNRLLPTPGF